MKISSIILLASIASLSLWLEGKISSRAPGRVDYSVEVKMTEGVALPCICKGRKHTPHNLDRQTISFDGRIGLAVSVQNAEGVPLNYRYEVDRGRIIGQGPNVIWNLTDTAPGKYSITTIVDDGMGTSGRTVKVVEVFHCHSCPCVCPALEAVSHFTQIKRGDTLDFEAWVFGGDFAGEITYHWTIENGTLVSGQGTPFISVKATGVADESVTATFQIGGIDRDCNCSQVATASVRIGPDTKTVTFPLTIRDVHIYDPTLYVECPRGSVTHKDSRTSDDLIADVKVFAMGNTVRDKLNYTYSVTGGHVIGSGARVEWDLTDFQPGTYSIAVEVNDGTNKNPPVEKKATVTLVERQCISLCPDVELSPIRRVKGSTDLVISAALDAAPETQLVWSTKGATIVAGQGTRSVRIRPLKGAPLVIANLNLRAEAVSCPNTVSRQFKLSESVQEKETLDRD